MTNANQTRRFIKQEISNHQVVIFSKTYCPYCAATKKLLRSMPSRDVVVHELDRHAFGGAIQQELLSMTGQRTVPSVFINGEHVGGNSDVQQLHADGDLVELLQQSTTQDDISKTVAENPVVIFSKTYCPYCAATKELLASMPSLDVTVIELDQHPKGDELQRVLEKMTGQRTVPNVFINGEHIGGNSDVQALQKQGRLSTLLAQTVEQ